MSEPTDNGQIPKDTSAIGGVSVRALLALLITVTICSNC
jgi:hypothetical protein